MLGQQITPWTFLKENPQAQNHKELKPHINQVKFRLPKILKKRETMSKQQNESNRIYFHGKAQTKHVKTMGLIQMRDLHSQPIYPLKKKTEPLLYQDNANDEKMMEEAQALDRLQRIRLVTNYIRNQLGQESGLTQNSKVSVQTILRQKSSKKMIMPHSFDALSNSIVIRIHDKNLDSKISALRSILKKQQGGRHKIKGKYSMKKPHNNISVLKLKIN